MAFLALLDYGMGNLASVARALECAGAELRLVRTPAEAAGASGMILPGVGNFGDGMKNLRERGFEPLILEHVRAGRPLMGICLGMQMMLDSSAEAPGVKGLGIFHGVCRKFPDKPGWKVPHVGWNQISHSGNNPFLKGISSGSFVYFVHSYYAAPENPADAAAVTDYILPFASALSRDNLFAVQFHPEKSQDCGLAMLQNFVTHCKEFASC